MKSKAKSVFSIAISICLLAGTITFVPLKVAAKDGAPIPKINAAVTLKGEKLNATLPLVSLNGKTMYPLRECLESIGAKVEWVAETKTAKATLGGQTVEFVAGSGAYKVGGKSMQMDTGLTSSIVDSRMYLPIKYPFEALGFSVEWDEGTQTINIT